jgi:hypothetical protein
VSSQERYDALKYTVSLRLNDLAGQQQRATTLAAADGVLLGVVASTSTGATGVSRTLVLTALLLLATGLVAAAIALWPRALEGLGSANPALASNDDELLNDMCRQLSATLADTRLTMARSARAVAIAAQLCLASVALGLLLAAAFVNS